MNESTRAADIEFLAAHLREYHSRKLIPILNKSNHGDWFMEGEDFWEKPLHEFASRNAFCVDFLGMFNEIAKVFPSPVEPHDYKGWKEQIIEERPPARIIEG